MNIGIGDQLRAAREEQTKTIEEASRATRVRAEYLQALETERFEVIGGDVYAKGFLASYARYLGLDPTPMLETYRRDVQGTGYDPRAMLDHPVAFRPKTSMPGWLLGSLVAVMLLVLTLAVANAVGGRNPTPAAAPTDVPASPSETAAATPTVSPSPSPSPSPTFSGVHLVVLVEQDCWIDLRSDGTRPTDPRVYTPGEVLTADAATDVVLTLGNAGGVRLELNGRPLGAPGASGEVVSDGRCTREGCDFVSPAPA